MNSCLIRNIKDFKSVMTSHNVGVKHVLLAANESGCNLTQVAITDLNEGDVIPAHTHIDMQEGFYVINGQLEISLNERSIFCSENDFIYLPCNNSHRIKAITSVRLLTFGCVI